METYSSLQKPITFMYFWLNYCDKNRIERIPVAVKDIDHLFNITSEIVEADSLHLFLLSDGTRIDDNWLLFVHRSDYKQYKFSLVQSVF